MRIGILLFMALVLGACQTTDHIHSRLVAAFDDATFHVAPDRQGVEQIQHNDKISRWDDVILYEVIIDDKVPNIDMSLVEASIAKFDVLIPVPILPASESDKSANLTISFANKRQFVVNGNQLGDCYAGFENDNGRITEAEVVLPGKDLETAYKCLDHELMHAIGFSGHTHRLRATLSYVHGEEALTKWDEYLITTLYNKKLEPGMKRDEALMIVEGIVQADY